MLIADARSLLFVPGNRPDRYERAVQSGADAAIIETAAAVPRIRELAAAPGVVRLAIGTIDFMDTDIACDAHQSDLAPLRFEVAIATRMAGLAPAVDGVTTATDDVATLREDVLRARRFGFAGKLCIHPRQIETVHQAFAPTAEEIEWARRVVAADAASGGSAAAVDGRMVDAPVVAQARRTLERAARRSSGVAQSRSR